MALNLNSDPNCTFCDIVNEKGCEVILYETEKVVVIKDINPAAEHHYLVISKQHIPDAKQLQESDKDLLTDMSKAGKEILQQSNANMSDARYGFHWPPFTAVKHLHLHAISPASTLSLLKNLEYKPDTWWFVTPEYVMEKIMGLEENTSKWKFW